MTLTIVPVPFGYSIQPTYGVVSSSPVQLALRLIGSPAVASVLVGVTAKSPMPLPAWTSPV